ncbi:MULTISPECIES: lipid-binding SYLF domain-containing protein [Thermotoga]|jgi:lipid-binding SYLF domain-containing protein|uniref:Ray-related protein n=1 Tax=Thermotoga neapolitana (strain ATCC 49049 / DSM 4359 / NBRC 107923 / NS-E) TaxID=309803 RepID=B9KAT2_THENN|nr:MULTISPECIES: YSC84-related protein [Thermotoga]MDK2785562.1 hypothetical protein [Thermotoga sp.]HBF10889.1 hypothetical protein [Thermotoga neapolitana]ACM24065.1 Ray-related protein [Thermotoga neapolitana DSM 4359]AJG40087.1 hypothetical protein TRQ7_01190 [Thermotoga sp. RQ7]KFZ20856.1 Ray-related protein [Thermotoga neapolitana LA10]
MKRLFVVSLILTSSLLSFSSVFDIIDDAYLSLKEFLDQPDSGAFLSLLERARGILIVPKYLKLGWVVGGQYGQGILLRRDPLTNTWYGPLFVKIYGLSVGPQIGFQSVSLIAVIMENVETFAKGNITLGGSLSVAAGPLGRRLSADYNLDASVYSYSIARGFYAGFSLEGAKIDVDLDLTREYYNVYRVDPHEILSKEVEGRAEKIIVLLNEKLKEE